MEVERVKNRIGQKVELILKNGYKYTTIIPDFKGSGFTLVDKFGKEIDIDCSYIDFIQELDGGF